MSPEVRRYSGLTQRTLALLPAALLLGACNSLLGIDPPVPIEPNECGGELCSSATAVCLFDSCTSPCQADSDCKEGRRCLATERAGGCVSIELAACESNAACPTGTICNAGQCRATCEENKDCLSDQECSATAACVGKDSVHDPAATCSDGQLRCAGLATKERETCVDGVWEPGEPCSDSELCDTSTEGLCKAPPSECQGRDPGETYCDGRTRISCSVDLVSVSEVTCGSVQHCQAATDAGCAICLPGEYSCDGDVLSVCSEDGTEFLKEKTCIDAPCSASAGDCTEKVCLVPGKRRCSGDVLEECREDGSGFDRVETCEEGLCDSVGLTCDQCVANEVKCLGPGTSGEPAEFSSCSSSGQVLTVTECAPSEPFCLGDGNCVECVAPSDCPADQCREATCSGNACGQKLALAGTECGDSFQCDEEGECVECLSASDCGSVEVCRSGGCIDANDQLGGNPSAVASFAAAPGTLYLNRLPLLAHSAKLSKLSLAALSTGASAKLVLYSGSATAPDTAAQPIAYTSSLVPLTNGPADGTPNTQANLSTGQYYWIGFVVNANVNVRYTTIAQQGATYDPYYHDDVPSVLGVSGITDDDNLQYSAFIKVIYTE